MKIIKMDPYGKQPLLPPRLQWILFVAVLLCLLLISLILVNHERSMEKIRENEQEKSQKNSNGNRTGAVHSVHPVSARLQLL